MSVRSQSNVIIFLSMSSNLAFHGEFGDSMVDLVGLGQVGFAPCNALKPGHS
jgi:hypothetical protein